MQKLLVPIDGSPASLCAVEHVIAHMDRNGTKVHLINVQQPVMSGDVTLLSAKLAGDLRRDAGERALQPAKAMLDANHFEYTAEVAFGLPAEAILDCASERHCTKIVMATSGRSLLSNIIRRSVPSRVIKLAHVPVTLVKQASVREERVPDRGPARPASTAASRQAARNAPYIDRPGARRAPAAGNAIATFITGIFDRRAV